MVGQLLWYRDRKQKKYVIEGSDEAEKMRLEEKEQGVGVQQVEESRATT
jgi:hypothetical protein